MSQSQYFSGPIKVSPDGRYFTNDRGLPFFWLGNTAWPLFAEYTPENARRYLLSRAELGYTVIQGVLGWGGGTGFETRSPGQSALKILMVYTIYSLSVILICSPPRTGGSSGWIFN